MTPLQQVLLAWEGLRRSARLLGAASLWAPWLILAAVQLALLACLVGFAHPALSWLMAPFLRSVAGEAVLRYPNLFRLLPGLYGRGGIVVGALLGAVMSGAALWMFARRFLGEKVGAGAGLRAAGRRALPLILANLPATVAIAALLAGSEWWLGRHPSGRLFERFVRYGGLGASLVVQAFFVYAGAVVVLEGKGALGAWRELGGTAARGFWAAFALSALLFLPQLPIYELGRHAGGLVQRGTPELVAGLVAAEIAIGTLTGMLMSGAVALVFLSAASREAEGRS